MIARAAANQQRQGRRERAGAGPQRGAAHPRERRRDARPALRRRDRVPVHGRRAPRTARRRSSRRWRPPTTASGCWTTRSSAPPSASTSGSQNARGDYVVRMDAHTEYPPEYVAKGIERLQRDDGVEWVTGPQIPHGIGPWSRRVAIALTLLARRRRLGQVGGGGGEGHRHRRLHRRLEALDARRVRRLGRRLAREPGLRAGGAVLRARQPDRLHARAGRAVHAARLAEEARQAVLALRLLPRQDEPLPPDAACAARPIFPPALVLAAGGRGDRTAPDPARRAASRSAPGPPRCSARARAPRASTRRATRPACPRCSPRCTSRGGSASCAAASRSGRRWRRWRASSACAADRTR